MNKIYKVKRNHLTGASSAVSELAKNRGKTTALTQVAMLVGIGSLAVTNAQATTYEVVHTSDTPFTMTKEQMLMDHQVTIKDSTFTIANVSSSDNPLGQSGDRSAIFMLGDNVNNLTVLNSNITGIPNQYMSSYNSPFYMGDSITPNAVSNLTVAQGSTLNRTTVYLGGKEAVFNLVDSTANGISVITEGANRGAQMTYNQVNSTVKNSGLYGTYYSERLDVTIQGGSFEGGAINTGDTGYVNLIDANVTILSNSNAIKTSNLTATGGNLTLDRLHAQQVKNSHAIYTFNNVNTTIQTIETDYASFTQSSNITVDGGSFKVGTLSLQNPTDDAPNTISISNATDVEITSLDAATLYDLGDYHRMNLTVHNVTNFHNTNITLGSGENNISIDETTGNNISIVPQHFWINEKTDNVNITNSSLTGNNVINLGNGDNNYSQTNSTVIANITSGVGKDTITTVGGSLSGNLDLGNGDDTYSQTDTVSNITINTGDGNDLVAVSGGSLAGNIQLDDDDNRYTQTNATVTANITASSGTDTVEINGGSFKGNVDLGIGDAVDKVIANDTTITSDLIRLGGGDDEFIQTNTTSNMSLNMGSGTDTFTAIGGSVSGYVGLGSGGNTYTQTDTIANVQIDATEGADVVTVNGGSFNGYVDLGGVDDAVDKMIANDTNVTGTIKLGDGDNQFTQTNTVSNIKLTTGTGNDNLAVNGGSLTGTVQLGDGDNGLTQTDATVTANITAGTGADVVTVNGGSLTGNVDLGTGDVVDAVVATDATVNGTIKLGDGDNKFTQTNTVSNITLTAGAGTDTFTATGGSVSGNVDLGNGENTYSQTDTIANVNITAGTGADVVTVNGGSLTGNVDLGTGDVVDAVVATDATVNGTIKLGDGDNQFAQTNTVSNITLTTGTGNDNLAVNGGSFTGNADLGAGDDSATLTDTTANGTINLGDDNNTYTQTNSQLTGNITSTGTGSTTATLINSSIVGNLDLQGSGDNTYSQDSQSSFNGNLATGAGNDTIDIKGDISGTISTGAGNDVLTVNGANSYNAKLDMGDGQDKATFSDMTLTQVDLDGGRDDDDLILNNITLDGRVARWKNIDITDSNIHLVGETTNDNGEEGSINLTNTTLTTENGIVNYNVTVKDTTFDLSNDAGSKLTINGNFVSLGGNKLLTNTNWTDPDSTKTSSLIINGKVASTGMEVVVPNGIIGDITLSDVIKNGLLKDPVIALADPNNLPTEAEAKTWFSGKAKTTNAGVAYLVYYAQGKDGNQPGFYWTLSPVGLDNIEIYEKSVSAYVQTAMANRDMALDQVGRLRERVGEQNFFNVNDSEKQSWSRFSMTESVTQGKDRLGFKGDRGFVQFGQDLNVQPTENGVARTGVMASFGWGNHDFYDKYNVEDGYLADNKHTGHSKSKIASLGAYRTWYGADKSYLDLVTNASWLHNNYYNKEVSNQSHNGGALALSAEVGKRFDLNGRWFVEPQAQLTMQYLHLGSFNDELRNVDYKDLITAQARAGARISDGHFYVSTNILQELVPLKAEAHLNRSLVTERYNGTQLDLTIGADIKVTKALNAYVDVKATHAIGNQNTVFSDRGGRENYSVRAGLRYSW